MYKGEENRELVGPKKEQDEESEDGDRWISLPLQRVQMCSRCFVRLSKGAIVAGAIVSTTMPDL